MFNINRLKFSSKKTSSFQVLYNSIKIATIFLVVLTVLFVRNILNTEFDTAERFLQQTVAQTSSNLKGRIATAFDEARILSAKLTSQTDTFTETEVLHFLQKHSTSYDYSRLVFTYTSGKSIRVARGGIILPTTNWTGESRFKKALNGEAVFVKTKEDSGSNSKYVNEFAVPVYDKNGIVVGLLGTVVDSDAFIKILSYSNYKEKATTYIIDNFGNFIVKPARDKDMTENIFNRKYEYLNASKEDVIEKFNNNDTGIFMFKENGKKFVAAFSRIGTTDCNLVTVIPLGVLMLHIDKLLAGIIAIIFTISGLLLALLYYGRKTHKEYEKIIYDTVFVDEITQQGNVNKFKLDAKGLLNIHKDKNFAMISISIKQFKTIGELYGTEKANQILKDFSKMIQSCLPKDSIFARDYNATFIVLYKYEKENFINKYFIEKLMDDITVYNEGQMQQTTATSAEIKIKTKIQLLFGIYLIDDKNMSIDQMCERAVLAKRQLKEETTKSYSYYDNALRVKLLQKNIIEDEMYPALTNGQFHMYLQPKFNLKTGNLSGAEALARWIHPSKGLIPPLDFIPLFEKNGFVIELDKCIWKQACEFLAKRRKEGLSLFPISVNVSRLHLYNEVFVDELVSLTDKYEIDPWYLILELTESASYEDEKQLKVIIKRLKELNFRISMDDFGTGYSSLSALKEIPFDVLKLDKSFVKDATSNKKSEIVIRSMIDLAGNLNMLTVAEGIETETQAELLRGMGCTIAQGFLYGKPMDLVQFEEFCETKNTQLFGVN